MVHPRAPPFISHLFLCHFCLFPPIRSHSPLGWGLYTCALLFFICARAPFHSSYISFLLLSISSYASTLPSVRGYTPARCYCSSARAPPSVSHKFLSQLVFIPPDMLPLFPRLGVIHLRAVIFHLHARPLPFLIYFSLTSFYFPL